MKIGKVSESVLKRSILKQIKTKREEILNGAAVGEDCAIFSLSEGASVREVKAPTQQAQYVLASCMQEAAVAVKAALGASEGSAFPVMTIGHLIQKCANNLAVSGATPIAAMITLLLPESIEEADIKELMSQAEAACSVLSMQIAGGQTTVSRAVNAPIAVVTGYGRVKEGTQHTARAAKPGQDIVVSKWIGLEGTSILAERNREKLLQRYPAYLVEAATGFDSYLSVIPEAATAMKSGVCAMHDASEGGIFAALWELAESAGVGLSVDLKKLPLRQETVEVCECCNVNPYELMSGGCLVMTTEDGLGLAAALQEAGIPGAIVGKITDSNDRILINEDEVRYMDRPKTDEIYKAQ